jgi:hypothetical protein
VQPVVVVVHVDGTCGSFSILLLWDSSNTTFVGLFQYYFCGTLPILLVGLFQYYFCGTLSIPLVGLFNTTHLVVFYVPFFGSDCFDIFTSLTNTHCCLMPRYCPGRCATTGGGGGQQQQQQQQRRDDDDQYVHSFQVGTVRIQCSSGHQIG